MKIIRVINKKNPLLMKIFDFLDYTILIEEKDLSEEQN